MTPSRIMAGKKGIVMGVANDRSLAWGIARACAAHGGEVALTYQNDVLKKRIVPLAESLGRSPLVLQCDVTNDASMDACFKTIRDTWGTLDFVVHAIAFSDKEELKGPYLKTSLDNFTQSMRVSVYSFTDIARRAQPLMTNGGSLLTLTYYGAERVMPHYNVMGVAKAALEASVRYLAVDLGPQGVRVNAISAGPIKTLAASGIGDFRVIMRWNELNAPLQRNADIGDIGGAGLYLLSDLSAAVTGEVHHVDCGYHTVGMMRPERAGDIADLLAPYKKIPPTS